MKFLTPINCVTRVSRSLPACQFMPRFLLLAIRPLCSLGIAAGILLVHSTTVIGQQLDTAARRQAVYLLPALVNA